MIKRGVGPNGRKIVIYRGDKDEENLQFKSFKANCYNSNDY